MLSTNAAVLKTILYFDIFDYPLNLAELCRFLHTAARVSFSEVEMSARNAVNRDELGYLDGYFFVKGRRDLVEKRQRRQMVSEKKIKEARFYIKIISLLPWVKMVALTGAAAMLNSDEEGDLDLMVVTLRDRLWLSRMLIFIFLELFGRKRNDSKRESSKSVCINVWCDEANLAVHGEERDLVLAHEISQAKILVNRGKTYEKFVRENLWLANFLANWSP